MVESRTNGESKPNKVTTAFSIAAELFAPTNVSELLRVRRGSRYTAAPDAGIETGAEYVGMSVYLSDLRAIDEPRFGTVFYALGKGSELFTIGSQWRQVRRERREKAEPAETKEVKDVAPAQTPAKPIRVESRRVERDMIEREELDYEL